jgi:hypothetical protein
MPLSERQNYFDGNYGVFGVGISPSDNFPNPLRTLSGAYGECSCSA